MTSTAATRSQQAVSRGGTVTITQLRADADALRREGHADPASELLTAVARRALRGDWPPNDHVALARVLRDHQHFSHARRLLGRVRRDGPDSEELRQQHALCTYKDLELSARRRLDWALQILTASGPLAESTRAETLGIAGAILKRRWEVDVNRADLEEALWCYQRGFDQPGDPERWYAGINAAFVADRLAALEARASGGEQRAADLRAQADRIRQAILDDPPPDSDGWRDATLGEALFGLGQYDQARNRFGALDPGRLPVWQRETTATQIATLAHLRNVTDPAAEEALTTLLAGSRGARDRALIGKVGVALSGGGFRASLFHLGVLARLAECRVLRHVEVLSCVSGGSIVGAHYYLKLRQLLRTTPDGGITDEDYVTLVCDLADEFLVGVRKNLRRRLLTSTPGNLRMLRPGYSRTDRTGELYEELFYAPLRDPDQVGPWRMPDLLVRPAGQRGFTLRYENWTRRAKVPVLVLNATTLNTGHAWQFTPTWMGEPPSGTDEQVDASRRLRRVDYRDAPATGDLQGPTLGKAVAASAGVPGLFPPVTLRGLYPAADVELVDGGVHDNQGVASLLEQDCAVLLVSDASGQLGDTENPNRLLGFVLKRANDILMKRVRSAQYDDLHARRRVGTLRGLLTVHLTKGLQVDPRDWVQCEDPWTSGDERPAGTTTAHGIQPAVQRALAGLRTDLDSFNNDEAFTLMAAGYVMTKTELNPALQDVPGLRAGDRLPDLDQGWVFSSALAGTTAEESTRLVWSLTEGHSMLLRRPRAWVRRAALGRTSRSRRTVVAVRDS